jgi:hypothetical protein
VARVENKTFFRYKFHPKYCKISATTFAILKVFNFAKKLEKENSCIDFQICNFDGENHECFCKKNVAYILSSTLVPKVKGTVP